MSETTDTQRIIISTANEAMEQARGIFAAEPEVTWIIATGDCTVAGVFFHGEYGDLVMHRAGIAGWTQGKSEEHVKERILTYLAEHGAVE